METPNHKIVDTSDEAFDAQDKHVGKPHGWIQWKGTEVCMDFHCVCGHLSHIDATFAYNVRCPKCKLVYSMSGYVEAIEVRQCPKNFVEDSDLFPTE